MLAGVRDLSNEILKVPFFGEGGGSFSDWYLNLKLVMSQSPIFFFWGDSLIVILSLKLVKSQCPLFWGRGGGVVVDI